MGEKKGTGPFETREARENEQCRWLVGSGNSEKHEGDRVAQCKEQHSPALRVMGDCLQPSRTMGNRFHVR